MITKEKYFEQAERLDKRINVIISKKAKLRARACSISSSTLEPHYNATRSKGAPFVSGLMRLWELEEEIDAQIDKYVDLNRQIDDVINALESKDEQLVIRYRIFEKMSWKEIGDEQHACSKTASRWYDLAMEHIVFPENPIII